MQDRFEHGASRRLFGAPISTIWAPTRFVLKSAAQICPAYFVHAEGRAGKGAADKEERLQDAFRRSDAEFVRSLVSRTPIDPLGAVL